MTGHSSWVRSVSYSPDGKHIVSGSDDKTVKLKFNPQCPVRGHSDKVFSVAYSPDGKHIVSGSGDRTVRIGQEVSVARPCWRED